MPSDEATWTVAEGTIQLRDMADEVEQFVLTQIDRLEHLAKQTESTALVVAGVAETETSEGITEQATESIQHKHFQREREDWETERQEEADRLQKEAILLQEAWSKFEEEQRRLLAEKELARRGVPVSNTAAPIADSPGRREALSICPVGTGESNADEQSAWLQFQRMRREIQSRSHPRP